jgi:hypothetical protein
MTCEISECEEFLKTLQQFPQISKLLEGIEKEPIIKCRPCSMKGDEGNARAALFDSDPLEIVLCTNRLRKYQLEEALTHELVHAYDFSNDRCDFTKCDGLAYAEIRAARYAECKGPFLFDWMRQKCIQEHATNSTKNFFADADRCVARAYAAAMNDRSIEVMGGEEKK